MGSYGSQQLLALAVALQELPPETLQKYEVAKELTRRITYLFRIAPPLGRHRGPSALALPHFFSLYVIEGKPHYVHTVADLQAEGCDPRTKLRTPRPCLNPKTFEDPFNWTEDQIDRIVYEIMVLFPDFKQPEPFYQIGEVLDFVWGDKPGARVARGHGRANTFKGKTSRHGRRQKKARRK